MKNLWKVFLILLFLSGCRQYHGREYRKFYFDNGFLMKEGYFNKNMSPVDTLKTYSPTGNLQWAEIYDTSGMLNGESILYYPNGKVEQKKYFINNRLNSWFYNYYDNGKIKSTGYFNNDVLQGDRMHFYANGGYKAYNFLDFYGRNLIVQVFDSLHNDRIEKKGDQIVADSIVYHKDSIYLTFLLSHPPFSKNSIYIKKIGEQPIQSVSMPLPDSARIFNIYFLKSSELKSVILSVDQYDSITKKLSEFNNRYDFYD